MYDNVFYLTYRRRRKKRSSQDSGSVSNTSQASTSGINSKKPPRKAGQKVRINETQNESTA